MEAQTTPIPSGGEPTALDMGNERDRGALRQAIKNWPKRFRGITDARKDRWLNDLDEARDKARGVVMDIDPVEGVKAIVSIVKTELAMELANQKDEHVAAGVGAGATVNIQQNAPAVYRLEVDRGG